MQFRFASFDCKSALLTRLGPKLDICDNPFVNTSPATLIMVVELLKYALRDIHSRLIFIVLLADLVCSWIAPCVFALALRNCVHCFRKTGWVEMCSSSCGDVHGVYAFLDFFLAVPAPDSQAIESRVYHYLCPLPGHPGSIGFSFWLLGFQLKIEAKSGHISCPSLAASRPASARVDSLPRASRPSRGCNGIPQSRHHNRGRRRGRAAIEKCL